MLYHIFFLLSTQYLGNFFAHEKLRVNLIFVNAGEALSLVTRKYTLTLQRSNFLFPAAILTVFKLCSSQAIADSRHVFLRVSMSIFLHITFDALLCLHHIMQLNKSNRAANLSTRKGATSSD